MTIKHNHSPQLHYVPSKKKKKEFSDIRSMKQTFDCIVQWTTLAIYHKAILYVHLHSRLHSVAGTVRTDESNNEDEKHVAKIEA